MQKKKKLHENWHRVFKVELELLEMKAATLSCCCNMKTTDAGCTLENAQEAIS